MPHSVYPLLIWLGVMSALAFVLFGWDKGLARRHRRRIPEASLLGCAILGGSAGALAGMLLFHHKTRKPAFRLWVPLALLLHAAVLAFVFWRNFNV